MGCGAGRLCGQARLHFELSGCMPMCASSSLDPCFGSKAPQRIKKEAAAARTTPWSSLLSPARTAGGSGSRQQTSATSASRRSRERIALSSGVLRALFRGAPRHRLKLGLQEFSTAGLSSASAGQMRCLSVREVANMCTRNKERRGAPGQAMVPMATLCAASWCLHQLEGNRQHCSDGPPPNGSPKPRIAPGPHL